MSTKSKHKNGSTKLKDLAEKGKQELMPPDNVKLPMPGELETVSDIRAEMRRIYRLVFEQKIILSDATRLAYYLTQMIQAIKTETELNTIAAAYAKAWGGVAVITDEEALDAIEN